MSNLHVAYYLRVSLSLSLSHKLVIMKKGMLGILFEGRCFDAHANLLPYLSGVRGNHHIQAYLSFIQHKSLKHPAAWWLCFKVDFTLESALKSLNLFNQGHLRWINNKLIRGQVFMLVTIGMIRICYLVIACFIQVGAELKYPFTAHLPYISIEHSFILHWSSQLVCVTLQHYTEK